MNQINITVYGIPVPQGSMKAFIPRNGKFPIVTADNKKTKPWRQQIAGECLAKLEGTAAGREIPIRAEIKFFFPKPKSVKCIDKTTKPDIDKLVRAVLDALTGIAFEDDSQVTELHAVKLFGMPPRVEISVQEADFPPSRPVEYCKGAVKREGPLPF